MRFEKAKIETVSLSKRKSFLIERLKYNKFEF